MGKYVRSKRKQNRKHHKGMTALAVITILLGILACAAVVGIGCYHVFLSKIPRAEYEEKTSSALYVDGGVTIPIETLQETIIAETKPLSARVLPEESDDVLNVLLIGQSAREGEAYHMADSMILVSINKPARTLTLTSFLRDAYLKLPDYKDLSGRQHSFGNQRLNVCYHLGHSLGGTAEAMRMLNQCLYENFGVEVDFNIAVDFEGVISIVDYFGGVQVELTEAEAEYLNADDIYVLRDVQPGVQVLDGMMTLSYVRMRNAEGDNGSDIKRTARQRSVIEKLVKQAAAEDVAGLQRLMNDFLPYIVTNMTNDDITRCVLEIFPIVGELKIETGTCPAADTYWGEIVNIGGYDTIVLQFDAERNRERMIALTEGDGT